MILQRGVRYGERVTPSTLAYSIMDMESRIAEVHLPESEMARVRPDLGVEIRTDARPDKAFTGKVRRISPAVDPRSGTVKVTIDFEDPELLLKPGMFVRVNIIVDTHVNTVLIPRAAVLNLDNRLAVYVVRKAPEPAATPVPGPEQPEAKASGKASQGDAIAAEGPDGGQPKAPEPAHEVVERVFFGAGYQNEQFVEALSGIEPGDRLVHVGQQGLQPGAKVTVVTPNGNGAAEEPQGQPKNPAP
jgi:multidrug efflux pump subunit AcrA (membrane-fusion protein)